jgi:tetratricopeptide (TPR) repeat protein
MRALFLILLIEAFASADAMSQAKEHYRRGTQLYDLGRYLEAADEYKEAFTLSDRPAFLFNIGQAYRLAGKAKDALGAYQGFLRRDPNSPQRNEVEQHIEELKQQIEEEAKIAAEKAAAEKAAADKAAAEKAAAEKAAAEKPAAAKLVVVPPPRPTPVYKKWWLWTIVGVVVAGAATGIAVGVIESNQTSGTVFKPVSFQ